MRVFIPLLMVAALAPAMGGCVAAVAAGAGAGYMAADEINEGDGKFDPLEDVRDVENGRN